MPLNKQTGNMYPWITHTWNVIKGKCPHSCSYCYMKVYKQPELHFDDKELKTQFGAGKTIFVGSSCDAWAGNILDEWIDQMLEQCRLYPQNTYLFQSKNPLRFGYWYNDLPPKSILGTTLETCQTIDDYSKAPRPRVRYEAMLELLQGVHPLMVSIEPIMDFDLETFISWIEDIKPLFVSIGADSKGHNLPEPSAENLKALINKLQGITEIRQKNNLNRLLGQ